MPLDSEQLRLAMRAWTTGVAVIMATHAGELYGMTINSFTSVSLDPPIVSVTLRNATQLYELVTKARAFSLTILSAGQRDLAMDFAGRKRGAGRMGNLETKELSGGMPALASGLAWLACRVVHAHSLGENTLFLAEVLEARLVSTEDPLVYHDRDYHQLA